MDTCLYATKLNVMHCDIGVVHKSLIELLKASYHETFNSQTLCILWWRHNRVIFNVTSNSIHSLTWSILSIHTFKQYIKCSSTPNYHHVCIHIITLRLCYKFSCTFGKHVDCAQICCAHKAFFIILNLL